MTFKEYLETIYLHTPSPTRDGFDDWLADLDIDDVISHAEKWGSNLELKGFTEGYAQGKKTLEQQMGETAESLSYLDGTPNASNNLESKENEKI